MSAKELFLTKAHLISALTDRDGYFCYLCKNTPQERGFSSTEPPTIEHVIPLAKGGTWSMENLKLAHRKCNVEKADRLFLEDGTLEPKRFAVKPTKKVDKEAILNNYCTTCEGGRLLFEDEMCPDCGANPGPHFAPRYLKRQPKQCDHSRYWCWMCSIGLIEKKSSALILIEGE